MSIVTRMKEKTLNSLLAACKLACQHVNLNVSSWPQASTGWRRGVVQLYPSNSSKCIWDAADAAQASLRPVRSSLHSSELPHIRSSFPQKNRVEWMIETLRKNWTRPTCGAFLRNDHAWTWSAPGAGCNRREAIRGPLQPNGCTWLHSRQNLNASAFILFSPAAKNETDALDNFLSAFNKQKGEWRAENPTLNIFQRENPQGRQDVCLQGREREI